MPLYKDREFDFIEIFVDKAKKHYALPYTISKKIKDIIKIKQSLKVNELTKALKQKNTEIKIHIPHAEYGFKIKSFKHYK